MCIVQNGLGFTILFYVAFWEQVLGADEPIHERSQLSFPVIYHTQPVSHQNHHSHQMVLHAPQQPTAKPAQNKVLALTDGANMAVTTTAGASGGAATKGMSKTRKEIISAMISGQQMIQIEKLNSACQSNGVSETYL